MIKLDNVKYIIGFDNGCFAWHDVSFYICKWMLCTNTKGAYKIFERK